MGKLQRWAGQLVRHVASAEPDGAAVPGWRYRVSRHTVAGHRGYLVQMRPDYVEFKEQGPRDGAHLDAGTSLCLNQLLSRLGKLTPVDGERGEVHVHVQPRYSFARVKSADYHLEIIAKWRNRPVRLLVFLTPGKAKSRCVYDADLEDGAADTDE